MDYKLEAQKAVAFFDVVRTCIDNAEIGVVVGWDKERPGVILTRASSQIAVAARNLQFVMERLYVVAHAMAREEQNAAPVDGVSAGRALVPTEEVGSDTVSESAASPAKRPS